MAVIATTIRRGYVPSVPAAAEPSDSVHLLVAAERLAGIRFDHGLVVELSRAARVAVSHAPAWSAVTAHQTQRQHAPRDHSHGRSSEKPRRGPDTQRLTAYRTIPGGAIRTLSRVGNIGFGDLSCLHSARTASADCELWQKPSAVLTRDASAAPQMHEAERPLQTARLRG